MKTLNAAALRLFTSAPLMLHERFQQNPMLLFGSDAFGVAPADSETETTVETASDDDGIRVIAIRGMIIPRYEDSGWDWPFTCMDELQADLRDAIADPAVRGVILDIRSPGGICWLVPETAKLIRELSAVKPIYGVADPQAASAGYYLLAPCTRRYVTRSGEVGSIGVWTMHVDQSKMLDEIGLKVTLIFEGAHKVDGNPFEPLPDDVKADLQREVKITYDMFTGDVAQFVGVSLEKVLTDFGQGRCLQAADALAAGMVDGIASLDDVRAALTKELDAQQSAAVDPLDGTRAAIPDLETRSIEGGEVRAVPVVGSETPLLSGTALKFGSASRDLGGFREVFEAGAFADAIATNADDARVIWQHDPKCVFGRVKAGTATITEDATGIHYTAEPPDAQWARDAMASIRRGDVDQNSFAFMVAEPRASNERWERRKDGIYRIISKARLVEVGPQTHPAYADTSVAVRSMQVWQASNPVSMPGDVPEVFSRDLAAKRLKLTLADI